MVRLGPLIRIIAFLVVLSLLRGLGFSLAIAETSYPGLEARFKNEIEAVRASLDDPNRISGYDRFLLMFSLPASSTDEQIARNLLVLQSQQKVIDAYLDRKPNPDLSTLKDPPNQLIYDYGLKLSEVKAKLDCRFCKTSEERASFRRAVSDLHEIFDLHDIHDGFSGLPFYGLVKNRFHDPKFQSRTINLSNQLSQIIREFELNPTHQLNQNILKIALQSCNNDADAAVELLGILTSRDVLVTRYLRYLNSGNRDFVRAFAEASVQIRLIAELDMRSRGSDLDFFSVADPKDALSTRRNYYYWSSALAANRLRNAGHSSEIVSEALAAFVRQYKSLRFLEGFGPFRSTAWKNDFKADRELVSKIARAGAEVGGIRNEPSETESPSPKGELERLESFFKTVSEPPSVERQQKIETLRAIGQGAAETKDKAYLLYYDVKSDLIGYPHLKLVMDGQAYEIHRIPKKNGGYLRTRPLSASLRDAREGHLPSGILEFPITPDQAADTRQILEANADASMRYAFFNKLVRKDTYNCGGVLYEALRLAGVGNLPPLPRVKALPGQMIRYALRNINDSRFIGRGDRWTHELVWPNWSLKSIPRPIKPRKLEPPAAGQLKFGSKIGPELIEAEQALVEKIPAGADPINMLGKLLKIYSNNGALPTEFTPGQSGVLPITSLLIPEEDFAMIVRAKQPSAADRLRVKDKDGRDRIRFFIHPNELEHYKELIDKYPKDEVEWIGTPSSSARSLYAIDTTETFPPFIVKTSLSIPMGGTKRLLDNERVARAVTVNDLMQELHTQTQGALKDTGKSWDFFKETFAALPPRPELGGSIFREIPEGLNDDIVLPFYSLIADRSPKSRWIDELFAKSGRPSMSQFVWEDIVRPLVELHAMLMENGITSELHQQNVCLKVDRATGQVKGFVLKDMDGNWVDHSLRVNRLGKKPIHFSNFENDAYLFRYAMAPENHYDSYVDMLRERNIRNTFQYALAPSELSDLVSKSDEYLISRFNKIFPEFKIQAIFQYKAAWKQLSDATVKPEERIVYEKIRTQNQKSGIENLLRDIYNLKLEANLNTSKVDKFRCVLNTFKKQFGFER